MRNRSISRLFAFFCVSAVGPSFAADLSAEFIGARVGTNAGDDAISDLQRLDLVGQLKLPWLWRTESGAEVRTHLELTGGLLRNDDDATLIATASPGLEFADRNQRIHITPSIGLAVIPDYRLGQEDFGGPVQFTYGLGIGLRVYKQLVVGYRIQHFSDARIYGSDNRGVDMHMLELRYRIGGL